MIFNPLTPQQWREAKSETEKYRHLTAKYCDGCGVDIASQGVRVVPWAIGVDLPLNEFNRYCNFDPPKGPIQIRGHAQHLPFEDESLDFVYSSHLLEDFKDWTPVLSEWVRTLKIGGNIVILVPDKARWNQALDNGQQGNPFHQHEARPGELSEYADALGLEVLEDRLTECQPGDYTILFAARKIKHKESRNMEAMIQKWRPMLDECRVEAFTWTGDELCWALEHATTCRLILEIGVAMGFSSLAFLRANPTASVVGVDSFHLDGREFATRKTLKAYLDSGRYQLIAKRSIDAVPHLSSLRGKVDMAFIDGDHDYESVATDIHIVWPLLRMGGVMFGHDYVRDKPDDGLVRAVRDLLPEHESPWPLLWKAVKNREL